MAHEIMKFLTYRSSKRLRVVLPYDGGLRRGVQHTMDREEGGQLGPERKPEEGTLIYLTSACNKCLVTAQFYLTEGHFKEKVSCYLIPFPPL